ncbi:MAG: hypothetical protein ABIO36_08965 [Pyrinomonadaceae bacterium]
MDTSLTTNKTLFTVCGLIFVVPCLVSAQFSVRLVYRWLTVTSASNGSIWTVVWAIFFPAMTIICGLTSWYFFRGARRRTKV